MLFHRLFRYSTCALLLAALAPTTRAEIIYTLLDTPISANGPTGVQLNLMTGAHDFTGVAGWDFDPYFSGEGLTLTANADSSYTVGGAIVGIGTDASALLPGDVIGSSSDFINNINSGVNYASSAANFNVTGQEYLGLRFWNEDTSSINYAWVLLSTGHSNSMPDYGYPATILAYAYENTGAGITVGAIPEPASILLFALGGACWLGLARRRRS